VRVTIVAKFISIVFHPLLMATYLFLMLSHTLPAALNPVPMEGQQRFILLICMVTFLIPMTTVIFFRMMGTIESLQFFNRQDRVVPFLMITVFYGVVTYFFYDKFRIGLHDNVLRLMIVLDLLVVVTTAITFFYKVSVHSLCMWGMIGIVLYLHKASDNNMLLIPSVVLFLLTGLVMASRLQLNAHNANEIWFGAAAGFGVSFAAMTLLFQYI